MVTNEIKKWNVNNKQRDRNEYVNNISIIKSTQEIANRCFFKTVCAI